MKKRVVLLLMTLLVCAAEPLPRIAGLAPATILENLRTALRLYSDSHGENPIGANADITAALNGNNPRKARYLRAEAGCALNTKGELVDPWGTPYFFHQLSAREMEIRSAGPDRVMWTADDLVIK